MSSTVAWAIGGYVVGYISAYFRTHDKIKKVQLLCLVLAAAMVASYLYYSHRERVRDQCTADFVASQSLRAQIAAKSTDASNNFLNSIGDFLLGGKSTPKEIEVLKRQARAFKKASVDRDAFVKDHPLPDLTRGKCDLTRANGEE